MFLIVLASVLTTANERMVKLILSILDRAVVAIEDNKALDVLPQ